VAELLQKVDVQIHHAPFGEHISVHQSILDAKRENIYTGVNLVTKAASVPVVRITVAAFSVPLFLRPKVDPGFKTKI